MSFMRSVLSSASLCARSARTQAPFSKLPAFYSFSSVQARYASSKTLFTKSHEWVKVSEDGKVGTIGITDYAQGLLGDVVFVELPTEGQTLERDAQFGGIESVKAASDIYAPVSGTVTAINGELASSPGIVNSSPEDEGWLAKIELSNPDETKDLLNEEDYKAHCEGEADE